MIRSAIIKPHTMGFAHKIQAQVYDRLKALSAREPGRAAAENDLISGLALGVR